MFLKTYHKNAFFNFQKINTITSVQSGDESPMMSLNDAEEAVLKVEATASDVNNIDVNNISTVLNADGISLCNNSLFYSFLYLTAM